MKIQILLMANSKKLGGRCLAGLRTDNWTWVRPVSSTHHGAIATKECEVVGGILRPLDLIVCDVSKHVSLPHQAENFLVKEGSIRLLAHVPLINVVSQIKEVSKIYPYFLCSPNPSIPPSYFAEKLEAQSSLALVEVESAVIDETRHIKFKHKNVDWKLKLTDEHFLMSAGVQKVGPAYLCVSVGEYWQKMDAHWKFVAGIIPISNHENTPIKKGQIGTVVELSIALSGVKPILAVPRFSSGGWFYQGPVNLKCLVCSEFGLHSFRKHYLNNGNTAHYWSIVCTTCKTAKELADFNKDFAKGFKALADEANELSAICKSC